MTPGGGEQPPDHDRRVGTKNRTFRPCATVRRFSNPSSMTPNLLTELRWATGYAAFAGQEACPKPPWQHLLKSIGARPRWESGTSRPSNRTRTPLERIIEASRHPSRRARGAASFSSDCSIRDSQTHRNRSPIIPGRFTPEEAGIRSTGIGCYFDDPAHEVFGISSRDWQSFYHFTVGGPVEDVRLTTIPAYGREAER